MDDYMNKEITVDVLCDSFNGRRITTLRAIYPINYHHQLSQYSFLCTSSQVCLNKVRSIITSTYFDELINHVNILTTEILKALRESSPVERLLHAPMCIISPNDTLYGLSKKSLPRIFHNDEDCEDNKMADDLIHKCDWHWFNHFASSAPGNLPYGKLRSWKSLLFLMEVDEKTFINEYEIRKEAFIDDELTEEFTRFTGVSNGSASSPDLHEH